MAWCRTIEARLCRQMSRRSGQPHRLVQLLIRRSLNDLLVRLTPWDQVESAHNLSIATTRPDDVEVEGTWHSLRGLNWKVSNATGAGYKAARAVSSCCKVVRHEVFTWSQTPILALHCYQSHPHLPSNSFSMYSTQSFLFHTLCDLAAAD